MRSSIRTRVGDRERAGGPRAPPARDAHAKQQLRIHVDRGIEPELLAADLDRSLVDREHHLDLHDDEWIVEQPPERLADLYNQFHPITDDGQFTALCEQHDLDVTNLNRLRRTLTEQLDEQDLHDAVYGRNPYRDPSLPDLGVGSPA